MTRGSAARNGTETMFHPARTGYARVTVTESVTRAVHTLRIVPSSLIQIG